LFMLPSCCCPLGGRRWLSRSRSYNDCGLCSCCNNCTIAGDSYRESSSSGSYCCSWLRLVYGKQAVSMQRVQVETYECTSRWRRRNSCRSGNSCWSGNGDRLRRFSEGTRSRLAAEQRAEQQSSDLSSSTEQEQARKEMSTAVAMSFQSWQMLSDLGPVVLVRPRTGSSMLHVSQSSRMNEEYQEAEEGAESLDYRQSLQQGDGARECRNAQEARPQECIARYRAARYCPRPRVLPDGMLQHSSNWADSTQRPCRTDQRSYEQSSSLRASRNFSG
jgi:hypothetical protein